MEYLTGILIGAIGTVIVEIVLLCWLFFQGGRRPSDKYANRDYDK